MVESDLKTQVRRYLEERGAFWSNVTGGPYSKPGDPDIVVCHCGAYIGLEAKYFDGCPSQVQLDRKDDIEAAGGIFLFPTSLEEVAEVLDMVESKNRKRGETP